MLEIAVFSTTNLTINNSVDFQNFLTKFCTIIVQIIRQYFLKILFKSVIEM